MSEPERWYPSKVDTWLIAVLALAPVVCLASGIAVLAAGELSMAMMGMAIGPLAFIALIYFGLVFPMRYGITDDAIIVRHGVIRQRIPLRDITDVYPTRNPTSSPALSLDRLYIKFGDGFFKAAMISPVDKSAFLDELAARAGLVRDGDRLVRK